MKTLEPASQRRHRRYLSVSVFGTTTVLPSKGKWTRLQAPRNKEQKPLFHTPTRKVEETGNGQRIFGCHTVTCPRDLRQDDRHVTNGHRHQAKNRYRRSRLGSATPRGHHDERSVRWGSSTLLPTGDPNDHVDTSGVFSRLAPFWPSNG